MRSGLNFKFDALFASGNPEITTLPLILISIVFFITRVAGKYFGAFAGCKIIKKPKEISNYMALAFLPQASVAIALAEMGKSIIGGVLGDTLLTVVLAGSIMHELVGPACAKLSLYLSKSYDSEEQQNQISSNNIETENNNQSITTQE